MWCRVAFVVACGIAETSCVAPPSLTAATNNFPFSSSIPIHDVVQRVKCDLTAALYEKIYKNKNPQKFAWMQNWTAKADLTLEVNESGGLTPSFSYIQPLSNAFLFGLGPNSINAATGATTNVVGATAQNFTLGVGGTLSASATRTETLSFNLSMAELKDWKDSRQKMLDKGVELNGIYSCDPSAPTDLQAGLDLSSWLNEALKPVESGDLQAGIHPTPSQSGPSAASSPAPKAAAGAGGLKTLQQKELPDPTLSPEQKAFLDLSLTTALSALGVPYDLNDRAYFEPGNPAKACNMVSSQPGKAVTFRPPSFSASNPGSLAAQSTISAQNAQSSASEVMASQILDRNIKRKAWQAAREAQIESLQVEKAAQYAAQRVLAVCEADTQYINPDKCISSTPAATDGSKPAAPTVSVASSLNPVPAKAMATITATVSASGVNNEPNGSVIFKEGNKFLGSATLNHGAATLDFTSNDPGTHVVTATYGNEHDFSSSSANYTQTVSSGPNASTITLSATPNPSDVGKQVTFTASVAGADATPTGKVIFRNGGIELGKFALEGGKARLTTTSLAVGEQSVSAEYAGDENYAGGVSGTISQQVQGGETSPQNIQLWSSANPSANGQLIIFTARVSGAKGNPLPTGSVLFLETTKGGKLIPIAGTSNPVQLKNGEATLAIPSLPVDTASHLITAFYSGDKFFKSANSFLRQYVVQSLAGVKYVVLQLSPYYCNGEAYRAELNLLASNQLVAAERNADLAKQNAALAAKYLTPDPPFESIGQSMNFVVTVGASTSPNWSFARWKGPSNSGTLASVTGIRTHSLNIAMGPVNGTTEVGRVLDNAAFRQAVQGLQQ
jgi:hypothetical protein